MNDSPTLELSLPLWPAPVATDPALNSEVNDVFFETLASRLTARGFSTTEPRGRTDGRGPPRSGNPRLDSWLTLTEGAGGVRARITIEARAVLFDRDGGVVLEPRLQTTTEAELIEGYGALDDIGATLSHLRSATAREAAAAVAAALATELPQPPPSPPVLIRKPMPITNDWAIPVSGELPLATWDAVEVSLDAEPALAAALLIGGWRQSVPLIETRPGRYLTRFRVPPGLDLGALELKARLEDASGHGRDEVLAPKALLADTLSTAPPLGLSVTRDLEIPADRLAWRWLDEGGVVHHYRIFRSDGFPYRFDSIGETHGLGFADPLVIDEHGFFDVTRRYFAVVAYDGAGNPSPPSELVSIAPEAGAATGKTLFPAGRWRRGDSQAALAVRATPVARYRATTTVVMNERSTVSSRELHDRRMALRLASGRIGRDSQGNEELTIVAMGSESARAQVSFAVNGAAWPLAEIEPGVYAGTVPLGSGGFAGTVPVRLGATPAMLPTRARVSLRNDDGEVESVTWIAIDPSVSDASSLATAPKHHEPER